MFNELLNEIYIIEYNCEKRQDKKILHSISEILFIYIVGCLSGCDTVNSCHTFAIYHEDFLKKYINLENGVPSNDTMYRVLAFLDKKYLERILNKWYQIKENDILSIDGKTVKGSKRKRDYGLHVVTVNSVKNDLPIAQFTVKNKSHEKSAITDLLDVINVKNNMITIDAIASHKDIADLIISKKGEYMLPIKDNQKTMHNNIMDYFESFKDEFDTYREIEKQHSAIEERNYYVLDAKNIPDLWDNTKKVGVVIRTSTKANGEKKTQTRTFVSSKDVTPKEFANIVRSHWSVEILHWFLDCSFHEDQCQVSESNAVDNLNIIRKFCLKVLKEYKKEYNRKESINTLRQIISYNPEKMIKEVLSC